ncbi:MAG: FAD-linked oxidase C-terminal domain-containing protein [Thermoleophilaceae bacterium]
MERLSAPATTASIRRPGGLAAALARELPDIRTQPSVERRYLEDATAARGIRGRADAVVLPSSAEDVASVVAFCYRHDVPITPRGGGSGLAGGAVPDGGVVLSLERVRRLRSFDPELWRMQAEAGLRTAEIRRLARESGLFFPPDPGAGEESQLGGNIATNAGGPHAFKYGVTGAWVTGIEAVIAPGDLIVLGGPRRKDVAGYDLRSLMIGSEGTLGIITAAWLRLLPAPEATRPVAAFYADTPSGCAAVERVLGAGIVPAALEFADGGALDAARAGLPLDVPRAAGFVVIAEADGSEAEAERVRAELLEALAEGALTTVAPVEPRAAAELWRWRDGVSLAVSAKRGGKLSEDIVVAVDQLAEAVTGVVEIGRRAGLEACSWGHAGDGNIHASFLLDPADREARARAEGAAQEVFDLALSLGGSVSGEHGAGLVKRSAAAAQAGERVAGLAHDLKRLFDPKDLLNPGKKLAPPVS